MSTRSSCTQSTVRAKTSGPSSSKPKTKVPCTEIPAWCIVRISSAYWSDLLKPLRMWLSAAWFTDSKPMSRKLHPERRSSSTTSGSSAMREVASPPHFFFSGIRAVSSSLVYSRSSKGLTSLIAKRRLGTAATSRTTSATGRFWKRDQTPGTVQKSQRCTQPRVNWTV